MKMTIEQVALAALLSRVSKAVESRNTLPILGNVLLQAQGNTLTAVASDLDIEVTSTAEATVTQQGGATVSASLLQAIVGKLSKGRLVTLEATDGKLTVSSGRSNLALATLPVVDFPRIANEEYTATFQAPQLELQRLFDLSAFAMSTEETRYFLRGVFFHTVDGMVTAVATDGHRLAKAESGIEAEFPHVIIPSKTVNLMKSLLDDGDATVSVSETKVRVDMGHTVVVSKSIDGVYPDYSRIIPTDHQTEVVVSAADVKQASALVTLVSADKTKAVKVSATEGNLRLTVRNGAEIGEEDVDAELIGPEVEAGVNSKYLADVLQACNGDSAVLRFRGSGDAILIQPKDDDKALFLLMPMRI